MNEDKIRKENRKALKTYIPMLILCAAVGVVSGLMVYREGVQDFCGELAQKSGFWLYFLAPYGTLLAMLVPVVIALIQYSGAKKTYASWDEDLEPEEEEEDPFSAAERKLSFSMMILSTGYLSGMAFFAVSLGNIEQNIVERRGLFLVSLIIFVAGIFLSVWISQLQVDLVKKMNPGHRGSVYDMNFHSKWEQSCDEAEKLKIYQAAYKAFRFMNVACSIGWILLSLGNVLFHFGNVPVIILSLLWIAMNIVYYLEAMRLEGGGFIIQKK